MQITIPNESHFHAVLPNPATSEPHQSGSDSLDSTSTKQSLRKPMKTFRRNSIAVMSIATNQEEEETNPIADSTTTTLQHARSPGAAEMEPSSTIQQPAKDTTYESLQSYHIQQSPNVPKSKTERKTTVTTMEAATPLPNQSHTMEEPPSPMQFTSVNYFGGQPPSNYNLYRRRAGSGASFSERAKMQVQLSCNDKHYLNSPSFAARRNFVGFPLPVKNASEEGDTASHDVRNEKLVKHILDSCMKRSKHLKDVRHEKFSPSNSSQNSKAASPALTPRSRRASQKPPSTPGSPSNSLNNQFEAFLLEAKNEQQQQ